MLSNFGPFLFEQKSPESDRGRVIGQSGVQVSANHSYTVMQ